MKERRSPPSLEDLDARLKQAQKRKQKGGTDETRTGIGFAFRIGTELVAALAVGVGIGWVLDEWLGTRPWLMIVFFVLGAAAGMLNVYRIMAGLGQAVGYKRRDNKRK